MLKVIKVACLVSFLPLGLLRTELLGEEDWINLLKGPELTGWKSIGSGEFSVEDGVIVVRGKRGYLLTEDEFKDFDFKCEVMTLPGSNSGIFFHTRSEGDRLKGGYEVQVNCTHRDPVKNGSIWGVVKSYDPIARDNEWFSLQITVRGKNIVTRVNDKIVVDYTEPDGITDSRRLGSGSIAIQAHDPKSVIRYRNLKIKKLAPPQPGGKRQKTQSQSARAGNRNVVFEDGFDSKLAEGWTWLKKNDKAWRFRDQALEIRNLEKQETVLACDVPDLKTGSYAIEVNLTSQPQPTGQYEQVGLFWYRGGKQAFKFVKERIDGKIYVFPGKKEMAEATVELRIVVRGDEFTAYYRPGGKGTFLEAFSGRLPKQEGRDQIAISCFHGPPDREHWIRIDNFRILKLAPGGS